MNHEKLRQRLAGRLFLAAMIDLTDGAYCVEHGQGAGMVQLGTLIIAPQSNEFASWRARWPKTFLPDDAAAMRERLAAEVQTVRKGLGDIPVCLSIGGFAVEHVVQAAQAFQQAGGDFLELNVHGGLQPWSDQGYFIGMALPQYRQRLLSWVEKLSALDIPLVVKFNTRLDVDFAQALHDLAHLPVWGYHFNVRDNEARQPKYGFVEAIRTQVSGPLFCSGFAWTAEAVNRLFALGVEGVGIADPARNDSEFIAKLAKSLP
jgi:tRNA-dihydrouridine synthase